MVKIKATIDMWLDGKTNHRLIGVETDSDIVTLTIEKHKIFLTRDAIRSINRLLDV